MERKIFRYSWTVLNVLISIGLPLSILFAVFNWKELSENEGWGAILIFGSWIVLVLGLILDFILQFYIRKKKVLNFFEGILVAIFLIINFL